MSKLKTEKELLKWYDEEYCLKQVKQDGLALQYVHNQTAEICLTAVKQDGSALRYVKDQTPKICLAAVKRNGWAQVRKSIKMF